MESEEIMKTVDDVIELVKDVPEPCRLTDFPTRPPEDTGG